MDSGAPFSFLNKSFAQSPIHSTLYTPYLALVLCCVCSFGMKTSNHLMMVVGPTVKNRVRVCGGGGMDVTVENFTVLDNRMNYHLIEHIKNHGLCFFWA